MKKTILLTATILGGTSVLLGAFAAHGLKSLISTESINTFETAVRYQFYYSLLLLYLGIQDILSPKYLKLAYWFSLVGVMLFSGSIYALATNNLTSFDFKTIGFITPIGGLFLIGTWIVLIIEIFRNYPSKNRN